MSKPPLNNIKPKSNLFPKEFVKHSPHRSWKVGKYYANSGTQNPALQKINSERTLNLPKTVGNNTPSNWPLNSFDEVKTPTKRFTSNSESKISWDGKIYQMSTINYQNRDYNFITHTVVSNPVSTTTSRQKGLGEYFDRNRLYKKDSLVEYQNVLNSNPAAFRKKAGEFTRHQDNCVKLSGNGPFHRQL